MNDFESLLQILVDRIDQYYSAMTPDEWERWAHQLRATHAEAVEAQDDVRQMVRVFYALHEACLSYSGIRQVLPPPGGLPPQPPSPRVVDRAGSGLPDVLPVQRLFLILMTKTNEKTSQQPQCRQGRSKDNV
jgi:hypothetical protein